MPIGSVIDVIAVALGGVLGAAASRMLSENFKENLNIIFGCCAMGMGIGSMVLMVNMPAVIFSIIIGSCVGFAMHLGDLITAGGEKMQKVVSRFIKYDGKLSEDEFNASLVTALVLFCASGTGIYGALLEGMIGEHTILLSKAILDLFAASIFACSLGAVVSLVAIPQAIVFALLIVIAIFIEPYTTETMIADFRACGGFLLLATGLRMANIKRFPIAEMLPAMVIVMPASAIWTSCIMPLL